jgi:hypothetical protein
MRRYASKLSPWRLSAAALVLLVTVLGLLGWQGTLWAAWPTGPTFDPDLGIEISDDETDANADIANLFSIPSGDLQFGAIVNFTPPEFYVPSLEESGIPIGTHGADLESVVKLGLIGGPCNSTLGVDFKMLVCTTDTSPTVTFDEQFSKGQGDQNLYDGCEYYPDFLNTLFPTAPIYRLWGWKNVSGVLVSMNFVIFEPGTSFPDQPSFSAAWGYPSATVLNDPTAPLAPGSISDFCSPLVSNSNTFGITKDNTDVPGDESGYEQRRNPCAPGTYTFRSWARSTPDAEGDGFETDIDNCPWHDNIEDIRAVAPGSDPDGDGIDSACDPAPALKGWAEVPAFTAGDVDSDGYHNRQDNCPFVPDPTNLDSDSDGIGDVCDGELPETDAASGPNADVCDDEYDDDGDTVVNDGCPANGAAETTCDEERLDCADANGAPPWDACDDDADTVINDGCDAYGFGDPDDPDGTPITVTLEYPINISGSDVCCGEDDSDCDGWDDEVEEQYGSDPDDPDSTPEDAGFDEEFDEDSCTDGVDNDLDGDADAEDEGCAAATATPTPTAPPTVLDSDGDGFDDALEIELGSDPADAESTPENVAVEGTCTDGADNDGDGLTDGDDEGCVVTPTATPTPAAEVEVCEPVFPGTYNGLVRIDGAPAASGYEVVATIAGNPWGSAFVSGGRYAMDIPETLPTSEPCFEAGTLTFELNGMTCTPSVEWASGLQNVDLECEAAAPPATPSPTAPVPSPTAPVPSPTGTPVGPPPTGSGGLGDAGSSLPLWAMALVAWAGLMSMAGLGVLVRR